tara:strand:- start:21 stop:491 length:471 start_codon:yes stop_codon:yes gene_type:complete
MINWCIFLMISLHPSAYSDLIPYVWSLVLSAATVILTIPPLYVARFKAKFELSDLSSLRAMFDRYPDWGKRASWAHQNCFESFTLHAPAVLLAALALLCGHDIPNLGVFAAVAHPILRMIYIVAYLANISFLRSVCWAIGLISTGIIYGLALSAMI